MKLYEKYTPTRGKSAKSSKGKKNLQSFPVHGMWGLFFGVAVYTIPIVMILALKYLYQ